MYRTANIGSSTKEAFSSERIAMAKGLVQRGFLFLSTGMASLMGVLRSDCHSIQGKLPVVCCCGAT